LIIAVVEVTFMMMMMMMIVHKEKKYAGARRSGNSQRRKNETAAVGCQASAVSRLMHSQAKLPKRPERPRAHIVSYSVVTRSSFPWYETADLEADHSPP
jgi:hypothetical protein